MKSVQLLNYTASRFHMRLKHMGFLPYPWMLFMIIMKHRAIRSATPHWLIRLSGCGLAKEEQKSARRETCSPTICICHFLPHLFQVPFNVPSVLLLWSVEAQLFKLTSYLPRALFLLLCGLVMSQPPQNCKEINDSLRTGSGPIRSLSAFTPSALPTCLHVILSLTPPFLSLTLIPSTHRERPQHLPIN